MDWINKYKEVNNSFKKKLVFNIGVDAGFFSEYNNMILAMLYCLKNEIKFSISSKYANFSVQNGITDYFLPFCSQDDQWFNKNYNTRPYLTGRIKYPFLYKPIKRIYGVDFFTQDLWDKFHNKKFEKENFRIDKLGINGSILEAARVLIENIWRLNPSVRSQVQTNISSVGLPKDYIGFHIRRGDKFLETKGVELHQYFSRASKVTDIRNAFIATDDYRVIEQLTLSFPEWKIFTLCKNSSTGYDYQTFHQQGKAKVFEELVDLLTDIEVLSAAASIFVTYSSNIGMFLGMRKGCAGASRIYSLDYPKWLIW